MMNEERLKYEAMLDEFKRESRKTVAAGEGQTAGLTSEIESLKRDKVRVCVGGCCICVRISVPSLQLALTHHHYHHKHTTTTTTTTTTGGYGRGASAPLAAA